MLNYSHCPSVSHLFVSTSLFENAQMKKTYYENTKDTREFLASLPFLLQVSDVGHAWTTTLSQQSAS